MKPLTLLYALNAAILVAHEIDSAYWREWEMFGLGGGIGGFVLSHVPLVLVVLWGFERLLASARAGLWTSLLLSLAGLGGAAIHSAFLLAGHPEFRHPVSLGVLAATAVVSLPQLVLTALALRAQPPARG